MCVLKKTYVKADC